MSKQGNSSTRSFETVGKKNKGFKSPKSRQRFVIAIFVVIILIFASLATLVIGQIISKLPDNTTSSSAPKNDNILEIPQEWGDLKVGDLLIVDENYAYNYPNDTSNIVNLWAYKNNTENKHLTTITAGDTAFPTYQLHSRDLANQIGLDITALEAFNRMMLDYCKTLDLSSHKEGSASGLNVAWGYSDAETLAADVESYGNGFYDHALGTTVTLRDIYSETITEKLLREKHPWIYENAHKYGFIVRYPENCNCERSFDVTKRVHLRYIGIEHATYIYENGICLEEYLTLLREHYKASGDHLTFGADGKSYEVYYVKFSGDPTLIPVPKNESYTISGDNMNGYIVTVEK